MRAVGCHACTSSCYRPALLAPAAMEVASAYDAVKWLSSAEAATIVFAAAAAMVCVVAAWWLIGWWLKWPQWRAVSGLIMAVFRMVVMRGRRSFGEIRCVEVATVG